MAINAAALSVVKRSLRLLILLNRVSDADLRIARDRFSQRTYRNIVWDAAADLGHDDVFAPGDDFDAPPAGHRSFIDHGMRRVVSIVDPVLGAGDVADAAEFTADDGLERSSEQSLGVVGEVVLAGLDRISARLAKIDRFSEVPEPEEPSTAEKPAEADASGDDSEATAGADSGASEADAGDDAAEASP